MKADLPKPTGEHVFSTTRLITFRDADPAGVLFFARYLALAHDAYEEFLASRGVSFRSQLTEGLFILPIIHAECDYRRPLWIGDRATLRVTIVEIKRRTFTVAYELLTPEGKRAATCRTVHAAVDTATRRAIPLPSAILAALQPT